MKNKLVICSAALVAVLSLSRGARAAEPERGNICLADPACAEQLSRAAEFSKNKQLPEALAAYVAAYERRPYAPILFNIARLHHRLGQPELAAQYYQRFIDAAPAEAAEQVEKARGHLEQAKKESAATATEINPVKSTAAEVKPEVKPDIKTSTVEPRPGTSSLLEEKSPASSAPSAAPLFIAAPKNDRPPFYRRNWFWGVVGGVIGGSAVGVIVGIVLRPRSLPDYATTIRFITPTGSTQP
jgi:tetratricopeptide (TPR) repeat protein